MSLVLHTAPPYYVVIFTSIRTDSTVYHEIAEKVLEEAKIQEGFLGFESVRDGVGISLSYWKNLESIENWKTNTLHKMAQDKAREFYTHMRVRVCKVEKEYGF